MNLETAVTTSDDACPGKGIHYRMHPGNVDCLTAARIDCCLLANNHVLDWGRSGLTETLQTLHNAGLHTAGAGADGDAAWAPAVLPRGASGQVLVFGLAAESSGVPRGWGAGPQRSGVAFGDHGSLRSDVGCLYFATLDQRNGKLQRLDIVPLQLKKFRLGAADAAARRYLESIFNADGCRLGQLAATRMLPSWPLRWARDDE